MVGEVHRDAWYGCYARSLRALLAPAVPAHPAKMAWGLALRLLTHVKAEGWLPPGGLVLDPLAGSGVTGLACSMCGVRSVLGELEAHCLAALAATVARHRARWQALGYPVPLVLRHDARHLPLRQVEVIISSPPYPGMVHARNHIDPQKLRATHTGRSSQAHAGGYGTHPAQVGVLRPTAYWEAMQDVYRQCSAVLPVGGHLVLVVKGMIRQGRYVDTPTQTAALLEEVGFVVQHWHHAMLTAREAQLTFDGHEERQRHLSFFRRVHARRGAHVFVDHEVVLCAEKPGRSGEACEPGRRSSRAHRTACPVLPCVHPSVILPLRAVPRSPLASGHPDTHRRRTEHRSVPGAIAVRHTVGRDAAWHGPQGSGAVSAPTRHP